VPGPIQSREDLLRWIDGSVLGDLRTLRLGVAMQRKADGRQADGRVLGGANYLLVAGCCMALEYLNFVYTGKQDSAVPFMRRFMSPTNERYGLVAELFWECFRHGPVHKSWPQLVVVDGDSDLPLILGVAQDAPWEHLCSRSLKGRTAFLVCASTLLRDIEQSVDERFGPWIMNESPNEVLHRGNPPEKRIPMDARLLSGQIGMVRSWKSPEPELSS